MEVEHAEKMLNELLDKREMLIARSAKLAADRQAVAYAAHTGDKAARDKLHKINDSTVIHNAELESIDAAIAEASARLQAAQRDEALAADRANAAQLREHLNRFVELGLFIDDAFADVIGASAEMNAVLAKINALGCPSPNSNQMRVMGTIAVKTAVMQIPWTAKEWEHLAPGQRKSFKDIIGGWRDMIAGNIAARLGEQQEKAA
jgi:hypothetical protein